MQSPLIVFSSPVNQPVSSQNLDISSLSTRRIALSLFVLLSCIYVLCSSGRIRTADEYMQFFQAQNLVATGSTTVPQAVHFGNFYGTFDLHGQPRAPYPPGQALMSAPLLDLARFVLVHFPGVPHDDEALLYVQVFGAVLTSALCAAGAMAFFFLSLRALGVSQSNALLGTSSVAFGTLLFPYSGYFFSEPFTAVVLLAAVFEIARSSTLSPRGAITAGMLLAFSIWIRPTMVFATPVFVIALILRARVAALRAVVLLTLFPMLAGFGYLLWNKLLFGRALEFGYPDVAEMGKQLNSFHAPFYIGLQGLLLSPGKSIFIFFPVLLLAIPAILRLWRRDQAIATLAVGLPLTYLIFYMRYTQWEGGLCPGPRYLLPFLCVSCLALGPALESWRSSRAVLFLLAGLGLCVQIITYATSFLEDQAVGVYYDSHFNYLMSYDPLVSQTRRLITYLKGKPARLGLGFDRWFVFLHKLGVSVSTEVLFALVPLILGIVALVQLRKQLMECPQPIAETVAAEAS